MIYVHFKNLEKSEFAKEAVFERTGPLLEKFPGLKKDKLNFYLSMENSPVNTRADLFTARIQIKTGQYKGIILEKSSANLYSALADLMESAHERLKRHDERKRVNQRKVQRRKKSKIHGHSEFEQVLHTEMAEQYYSTKVG